MFDNDNAGEKGQEKLYNLIKDCDYINVYKKFRSFTSKRT